MINISGKTCLFDTNILVALLNADHPDHFGAVSLFDRLQKKEFHAVLSSQNLFELTAVLVQAYKIGAGQVASDMELFLSDKKMEIVYPDVRVMEKFLELLKLGLSLHVSDIYLLSTLIVFDIPVILTGDKYWQKLKIPRIAVYNPFLFPVLQSS